MTYPNNSDDATYRVTSSELRGFIERIENLNEDRSAIQLDIKEVFAEAKSRGYDSKAIRKLIGERKRDPLELSEEEAVLELYREALNDI